MESSESMIKIHSSPVRALADLIKCSHCNAAMSQVSAKGNGYYGCRNAKRKKCTNRLVLPVQRVVTMLLDDLRERFLIPANPHPGFEGGIQLLTRKIAEERRAYYIACTSIQILALLGEEARDLSWMKDRKR